MIIIKILVSLLFCLFSMRPIFKAIKRGSFSLGLNSDEASVGYEVFSLINNGVDRNGVCWPLYMIWGSG